MTDRIPRPGDRVVVRRSGFNDIHTVVTGVFRHADHFPPPYAIEVEAEPSIPIAREDCRPFEDSTYWTWPFPEETP